MHDSDKFLPRYYKASLRAYFEFETMPDVNNHMLDITNIPENLQLITHRRCITALFDNVPGEIKRYCTFKFHPNSAMSTVVMLDASTVLFNNVTKITRRCRHVPVTVLPGCKHAYFAFHVGVLYTRIQSIFHLRYQNVLFYVEMLLIVSTLMSLT